MEFVNKTSYRFKLETLCVSYTAFTVVEQFTRYNNQPIPDSPFYVFMIWFNLFINVWIMSFGQGVEC